MTPEDCAELGLLLRQAEDYEAAIQAAYRRKDMDDALMHKAHWDEITDKIDGLVGPDWDGSDCADDGEGDVR